jgi:hypothetical protein
MKRQSTQQLYDSCKKLKYFLTLKVKITPTYRSRNKRTRNENDD